MADATSSGKKTIDRDSIVDRVLGEVHKPTSGVICIGGFIGQSTLPDHIRLFTKMDFSECLDIPEAAIVNQEKVQKSGIPEGSYIWIKRSAAVGLTVVEPNEGVSTFLQGPILRNNSARIIGGGGVTRGGGVGFFSTPICTIVVSLATVTFVICTRVSCPDPTTDDCPEPDPIPDPESVIV